MNKKIPDYVGKQTIYNSNYNDDKVILWDVIKIKNKIRIKFKFISSNSPNRQGVHIGFYYNEGKVMINGNEGKYFDLWQDECPQEFEIEAYSDNGYLSIYNIFEKVDWKGKRRYSQMPFSGMILEIKGNIYKYNCNDSELNTNFDDLIFEIKILE